MSWARLRCFVLSCEFVLPFVLSFCSSVVLSFFGKAQSQARFVVSLRLVCGGRSEDPSNRAWGLAGLIKWPPRIEIWRVQPERNEYSVNQYKESEINR